MSKKKKDTEFLKSKEWKDYKKRLEKEEREARNKAKQRSKENEALLHMTFINLLLFLQKQKK
jgi:hypothetical protein